jgi:hypothetical protein
VAALAAGTMTSAFAATVYSDTFSDGDAAGWSKSGGTWAVADGAFTQSSTSSELARQFAGQTAWTDYQVQARVRPTGFGSSGALVGIAARASSSTKMYRLALLGSGRADRRPSSTARACQWTPAESSPTPPPKPGVVSPRSLRPPPWAGWARGSARRARTGY